MLSKYLQEECIRMGDHAADRTAVLKAIARLAKRSLRLHSVSEEEILQGLTDREKVVSTGIGGGIALPHCILETAPDFVVGLFVTAEGIDFGALDGRKTKVFVFIIAPHAKKNEHLRVLSSLSNVLRVPGNVRDILAGQSAADICARFVRYLPVENEAQAKKDYKQITVIAQREEVFQQILQVLAAMPDNFMTVLEAGNASQYLAAAPLFANFRADAPKEQTRMILTAVNAALADEVIRRINTIIDGLAEKSGVVVFFQEIAYLNGTLDL